jgi:hypothetical protein
VARKLEVRGAGTVKVIQPCPFVSQIGRAQELAGLEHRISHVTGILLFTLALFLLPFEIAYAQQHLNRLWEREAELDSRQRLGAAPAIG